MEKGKQFHNILESDNQDILSFANTHGLGTVEELYYFPKYVQIETSALCNANCNMCPAKELKRDGGIFIMKQPLFDKIVMDLKPFAGWIEKLTIQGEGEPLIDRVLEGRIGLLKNIGIKSVAFATNGSLLDKKRSEAIARSGVDEVTFSVDGATAKTFEAIRQPLKFDLCVSNIEDFIQIRNNINPNLRVRIRMTIQEANIQEFDDFISFWRKRLNPNDCAYGRLWHSWGNWLRGYSLPPEQDRAVLNSTPCTAPFSTIFILSDGRVPLCCQDFNGKILLGDVNHSSIQQIWQDSDITRIRESHLSRGRGSLDICKDCNLWHPTTKKEYKKKEEFHKRHESFTKMAYDTPGLLPDRYVFILTNLCNLKCYFCFQKRDPRKNGMTAEDWISLAKELPDYSRVTLTGGEPLLFPGFEKVFSYVAGHFDCNIITNGMLLTEEIIDFLLSRPRLKVLSISIDSINNVLRGVSPEEWEKVEGMIRYFVRKRDKINPDCVLEAKTLILDENAAELLAIRKYCAEELGCDHHSFQFLKGSPLQHADYMFELRDIFKRSSALEYKRFDIIKHQLELIRQYNIQTGRPAFLHPKIASLTSEEEDPHIDFINNSDFIKENYLPCKFPWSSVHINVDGVLFPCLAVPMGNVKEAPLAEIINGERFATFKEAIRRQGTVQACNRCGWLRPKKGCEISKAVMYE